VDAQTSASATALVIGSGDRPDVSARLVSVPP
jgi:hypothetical protein